MGIVIALDAGTTGVRALAVDEAGDVVDVAYRELPQHFPRPGWVEHDLDEIWDGLVAVIGELVERRPDPVAAVGITNQRETAAAWDRGTGAPRHRAIVWQDRRTAGRCDELIEAGHLDLVRTTTGLVLDPYFTGTKFEWLLGPGGVTADDDLALGTIDSWLMWKLSGGAVHATEPSNASRTMLYHIGDLAWSEELCDLLGVPAGALPSVRPSSGRFGTTADTTALGAGVAIAGVAGDQQAALFGQACLRRGMTKNTYGTGSFVLMNVGDSCPPPVDGLLTTVAWSLTDGGPATYAYEGAIFVTGAAIQWLRDGLGIIDEAADIGPLAASVDDTGDVYLVPAFTGLGSPWWDPYARGTLVGLTRGTGRAEIARATVESMVYQTRDVVDLMTSASGQPPTELRVDGGASVMPLLLQLQADQLQVPVTRPASEETTALGAAYLAGLAEGVWDSVDDVATAWRAAVTFRPTVDAAAADAGHRRWLDAVARSRGWARPRP
ncbi:MAG: glycerol kinase GlpK [Acidimicrobiales bacterium]